jgi:hypothetical protein
VYDVLLSRQGTHYPSFKENLYQRCIHYRDTSDESTHDSDEELDETDIEAQTKFQKKTGNKCNGFTAAIKSTWLSNDFDA